jgi:AcrR family transcriptional regulator
VALDAAVETTETGEAGGKRERAKAANRDAILAAARRVFAQLGYEGASVRDIIRGTELASGTFYNYFRSKEEVFEALQDDIAKRFRPILHEQCERAETFEHFVKGSLDAYFHFIADERANGRILMDDHNQPMSVRLDTPEMKAVFDEVRVQIESAIGRGLAPSIDADYFAAAAIGVAREVGDRMLMRGGADVKAAADFCAGFILTGMAGLPRVD